MFVAVVEQCHFSLGVCYYLIVVKGVVTDLSAGSANYPEIKTYYVFLQILFRFMTLLL